MTKLRNLLLSTAVFTMFFSFYGLTQDNAPAAAPKFLYNENPEHSEGKISGVHPTVSVIDKSGALEVIIKGSEENYPGFSIVPSKEKFWDLSPWGHVKAKITNTGDKNLSVNMRVDNEGDWRKSPWNTESVQLKPGESKYLKVIFGYQYGYKPGFKLDPSKVVAILFFCGKSKEERSFKVEEIQAGGPAGEKPPVDPNSVVTRPEGGIITGKDTKLNPLPKLESRNLTSVDFNKSGEISLETLVNNQGTLVIRPAMGVWHLGDYNEIKVLLLNRGQTAVKISALAESRTNKFTDEVAAILNPNEEKEITISFIPAKPWQGKPNPEKKHDSGIKNTGTEFESDKVKGIIINIDKIDNPANILVKSIAATATPIILPEWIGKKPSVEGKWKLTLEDNFDGDSINLKTWNIYTANYWDKRTHFTKDNTIVKDGFLILRYEKKTGNHNDDPEDKSPVAKTDFACGFADSYGKWTQRYGYFEARLKLPTCPGLWPAFWMMPDRGKELGPQWKRASTHDGGMEFDIMEHLTAWGPYRYNIAFHWDGYDKDHKAIGTSNIYAQTDKEGFMTVGLLWLPGFAAYYANGKEVARWESERISSVQSYPIFYMVSGGWANVPLDESQLPADFIIDYIRVWQREDLASPEDGVKPNDGAPKSQY